uniref:Uncharacterized protein n=1 Tax=Oryza brachyantha TaxID=4533 RepID=J3M6J8_ORYBR
TQRKGRQLLRLQALNLDVTCSLCVPIGHFNSLSRLAPSIHCAPPPLPTLHQLQCREYLRVGFLFCVLCCAVLWAIGKYRGKNELDDYPNEQLQRHMMLLLLQG